MSEVRERKQKGKKEENKEGKQKKVLTGKSMGH
jgi:hypothetical protein